MIHAKVIVSLVKTAWLTMTCFCRYSVDEEMYRAKVLDMDTTNATVQFIDFGNCEQKKIQAVMWIRQIHIQWMAMPSK